MRYYTIPAMSDDVLLPVKLEDDIVFDKTPFRVLICNIADQKYRSRFLTLVKLNNDAQFHIEEIMRTLPTAEYAIVTCPIESSEDEAYTKSVIKMDQFIGSNRPVVGNGFFQCLVRQAIIMVPSGEMREVTEFPKIGGPVEGPFASRENWDEINDIRQKIEISAFKERLLLAVELFEKAARSDSPSNFFLYWVAMEVLTELDSSRKIKAMLAKAYNSDLSYIQNDLGFEKLINMRTKLFHHGAMHNISAETERYMQACFLDLLRHRVGLPCHGHLKNYVSNGYDVSKLNSEHANKNIGVIKITPMKTETLE